MSRPSFSTCGGMFDYSNALREIDGFFKGDHAIIITLKLKETLDEQIARKLV